MKTKAKNNTLGVSLELPRITRGVCATHSTNLAIEKIEKSLRLLGIHQCAACGEPVHKNEFLGGICGDCWAEDTELAEVIDFSSLSHHEISRCFRAVSVFELLADGRETMQYAPMRYRIAAGMEASLGTLLADALASQDWKGYWSPCAMRWEPFVGLVPLTCRVFPETGDYAGWRKYWQGKGKEKAMVPLF